MKKKVVCLLLFVCSSIHAFGGLLRKTSQQTAFPANWYTQTLDHSNPQDTRTFQQRFYENLLYWNDPVGPVILYINGEGPVSGPPSGDNDEVVLLAKKFGALIVTLEHRYYGLSVPFKEITTPNLQWLTSRQALNDLANFAGWYQSRISGSTGAQNKWITVGGSYSGALSAWFRLKFPHITRGSVSSSGVVNAILDFTAFDEQVAESVGPVCADALRETTRQLELRIFKSKQSELETKKLFTAEKLTDNGDFFYMTADFMAESVQYGYQERLCNTLVPVYRSNPTGLVETYANYTVTFSLKTLGSIDDYCTASQQQVTWTENSNYRQWWYQTCAELAYFQNAPAVGSIRSHLVNMTYHREHCKVVFGKPLWPDTNATNTYYGGNHPAATNVFYANGSQDPWKRASVLQTLSLTEPARVISCNNCGHCVDLRGCPGGCSNHAELEHVRELIAEHVQKWLA